VRAAIVGMEQRSDGTWKYKFADRSQIALHLAKHFGDAGALRDVPLDATPQGKTQIVFRGVERLEEDRGGDTE